ncbi:MAG TPA: chemotaxis protein CheA [Anaeromyxobacteraceae bacterium]|nr:chemotaxis protein CheA [Anaeromyxobacteraceae bacterium]
MDELNIDREALLATFLAEAEEVLGRMEGSLVALEANPSDGQILHALFRDAHTLKGAASLVEFDAVRDLAHDLENVLERLRDHSLGVSDVLVTLLLQSVDVLRTAVADAATGKSEPSESAASFRARLAQAASGKAATAPAGPVTAEHGAETAPASAARRSLRVDVSKLDRMLDLSGEIAVARGRLGEMLERRSEVTAEDVLTAHRDADRLYLDLQELIMMARMVPIGPVFRQHVRTVRDVAAVHGKQVRLVLEGDDVEVDTAVVERIRDPIGHMVRNAVDHGIESPAARRAAGKDPVGRLLLRAFHDTGSMVIQVIDDGQGLDHRRIAERAAAMGLVADPARLDPEEVGRLVFEPGLSTSEAVTEFSGRGVGMDVVRRNVEGLRGSVAVESVEGRGTTITIRVPLTLAIIQGFRVGVADETYILPLDAVVECLELPADASREGAPTGVIDLRGKPLPYLRLREHFGVEGPRPERENVVVVQHGSSTAGVAVDALHGESSTVIKPLGTMFKGIPGVAGSSILGDGRVALILDVAGLLRETLKRAAAAAA